MKRLGCFFLCLLMCTVQLGNVKAEDIPEVVSEFVYIYNVDSDKVLYEKNAEERMYPASITKIMSVLVAIEEIMDLDEMFTLPEAAFTTLLEDNASVVGYQAGDIVSIRDLLYGTLLSSGADAARSLAIRVAGSEENFVHKMNEKAASLGLHDTHFVNCTGLHDDNHYSTAKDLANLLKAALQNEIFQEVFAAERYNAAPTTSHPNGISMVSTRVQMEAAAGIEEDFITGSKTGYTLEGGLCLASTAAYENAHYIMITGNAGNDVSTYMHVKDTYTLYQSIFATYTRRLLYAKEEGMWNAEIGFANQDTIALAPQEDIYVFMEKANTDVVVTFDGEGLQAPIDAGDIVGNIHVQYQGEEVAVFPVHAIETVELNMWKQIGYWSIQVLKIFAIMVSFALVVMIGIEIKNRLFGKQKRG